MHAHDRAVPIALTGSLILASLALAFALVAGCGNSPVTLTPGPGTPPTTTPPTTTPPTGPWRFTPEGEAGAATAGLGLESIEGDRAWLRLTARGIRELQGIAFRLRFAPARLKVIATEQGPAWTSGSWFPTAARFTPHDEGELWGGVGFVGPHGLDASKETVVARIQVELAGADPIPLSFTAGRNLIIDPSNNAVQVSWLGGTFQRSAN